MDGISAADRQHRHSNRNVYLYSPQNSSKWYLWDWDNDGMLRRREREIIKFSDSESWERGVSNYWGNVLFRRCLQTQSYRNMLDAAMKELYAYMNKTRIQSMLEHYRSVTETYVWQMPDRMHVPITHAEYEDVLKSIWPEIEETIITTGRATVSPCHFTLVYRR